MMSQSTLAHPPRIASWLVELFAPAEQAESILGDLLEEFSDLTSKSGLASARRWYWRQSAKTIVHLFGTGLRIAPWSIVGIVFGGFLLLPFGISLAEPGIVGVIHLYRNHVTPYYAHLDTYVLWLNAAILIGRLLSSLFIGCIVAAVAKRREMVATITLGLIWATMAAKAILVLVTRHWPEQAFRLPFLVDQFGSSSLIVMGGIIVRESRSAMSRLAPRV
ncbi:MAG: permease prefix domain 2-containing transporter [Candidatus Acidiferrum sp.]